MGPVPAMDGNISKTECCHFSRLLSLLNSCNNDTNCNSIIIVDVIVDYVTVTAATASTDATATLQ